MSLWLPTSILRVSFVCYSWLAPYRGLGEGLTDLGEAYRNRLDPETVEKIDAWARDLVAQADASTDPVAVLRGGRDELTRRIWRKLTPSQDRGVRQELLSSQWKAEVCRIGWDPDMATFRVLRGGKEPENVDAIIAGPILKEAGLKAKDADRLLRGWLLTRDKEIREQRQEEYEEAKARYDKQADRAAQTPTAVRAMAEEVRDRGNFPWKTVKEVRAEVRRKAQEKARYKHRRVSEGERPGRIKKGEKGERLDFEWLEERKQLAEWLRDKRKELEVVVQFSDDDEQPALRLQQRRQEIEEEIRRSFRPPKPRNYLKLLQLYWQEGSLVQKLETAKRAGVSLRALQAFLAEARQRGWVKG